MRRTIPILLAALALTPLCAAPKAQATEVALNVTNALAAQQYLGAGKGVIVGILDAGIDVTHPAIRGSVYAERDFTGQKSTDDDKGDSGHATGIASIILGHDGKTFAGFAPAAKFINARITTADDQISDAWVGNGLIWTAKSGAKIVNMSIGNKVGAGPLTDKVNLISDYIAERYGVSITVAAGNENDSAVRQAPGGLYNGFSVGALGTPNYNRVTDFSNYTLNSDARTKPDLVAPGQNVDLAAANWEKSDNYYQGTGTSFAAPMVAGSVAQLMGYGKAHKLPTDPLLMKAVLLTSATKVQKNDGSPWDPRHGGRDADTGYRFTQPLDEEQGAGRLDAVAAYRLYAKVKSKSTPLNLWKEGKLKPNDQLDIPLGKFNVGQRVDATLTWYRHVAYKDKNKNGIDAKDTFYQTAPLADFVLTLLRNGTPIASSDSDVDNLEHLSWTLESSGTYSLEVYRFADSGVPLEDFALAARVIKGDGAALSKALGTSRAAPSLAYSETKSFTAVPEPQSLIYVSIALPLLARRKRTPAPNSNRTH